MGDHPRMCGEHDNQGHIGRCHPGSSPHVRGAQVRRRTLPIPDGIIPACAGSTASVPALSHLAWDHPRMCGEHLTDCGRN